MKTLCSVLVSISCSFFAFAIAASNSSFLLGVKDILPRVEVLVVTVVVGVVTAFVVLLVEGNRGVFVIKEVLYVFDVVNFLVVVGFVVGLGVVVVVVVDGDVDVDLVVVVGARVVVVVEVVVVEVTGLAVVVVLVIEAVDVDSEVTATILSVCGCSSWENLMGLDRRGSGTVVSGMICVINYHIVKLVKGG